MADKKSTASYKYKIQMYYIDIINKYNKEIKPEFINSIMIDHNYERNCMPIIYITVNIDKKMLDHMILHSNDNFITIAIYKYDILTDEKIEMECFRKKCIYFLPDNVNKNNDIDYTEHSEEQALESTYKPVTLGLLLLDHINNNKLSLDINTTNTNMYNCVRYCTGHIKNTVIEPFLHNTEFKHLLMPPHDSVNKALQYLNDYRVFYNTPYRYYNDFKNTYIISSSGNGYNIKDFKYNSIIFKINDILQDEANDIGIVTNKTTGNYEVPLSYIDTSVYDNSISNKSKNKIRGITSSGNSLKTLKNTDSYSKDKINNIRINNDNEYMLDNLEALENSSNTYITIFKDSLDTELFTINRRYTIHNIERYQELDGKYLLYRKREIYNREDDSFRMTSVLSFKNA